jgi:hypothetical protein
MTAQMLTMAYATISGMSFLHLRSSVTERMKPDGHQSGLVIMQFLTPDMILRIALSRPRLK